MNGSITTVGIIGSGTMGRGIAQVAALAGMKTILTDQSEEALEGANAFLTKMISRLEEKGKIDVTKRDAALKNLTFSTETKSLADAHMVVEAIVEDEAIKTNLFQQLENIVSSDCLVCTNTSSLSVTKLGAKLKKPERFAGLHFFNPVPLMKVVEVIGGPLTADSTVSLLRDWVDQVGHTPAVAKDSPGFIVNHAGRGYGTEALRVLGENIATHDQVDRIMKATGAFRMGPFELLDLIGLDVSHAVMESIYHQYYQEPRFRPSPLAQNRVDAGLLGKKTGRGFYQYENGKKVDPQISKKPTGSSSIKVWIGVDDPKRRSSLEASLNSAAQIENTPSPSSQAVCLVAPMGTDASSEAKRLGLNVEQVVAVDMFLPVTETVTLMPTPTCNPNILDAACLAFKAPNVEVIQDSPGFVTQRIIAAVVNVGCDIAQQGITSADELDAAVHLGLGYKWGPLTMGDECGGKRIYEILENLYDYYGDPRYRPSPWLKRRCDLGISLKHESTTRPGAYND